MGRRMALRGRTWVVEILRDWREPDIFLEEGSGEHPDVISAVD